jgi:cell division protein FtsB
MRTRLKRWAFGIAFVGVMLYAFVTLTGPRGVKALMDKRLLIEEMQKRNAIEAQRIERIKEHIDRIEKNPAEQELEIRDRLKLVHPDEKVFITGKPDKQ